MGDSILIIIAIAAGLLVGAVLLMVRIMTRAMRDVSESTATLTNLVGALFRANGIETRKSIREKKPEPNETHD